MNKLMLLTSASILAIGVGSQAAAQPVQSTLAALCGTMVSVDTVVDGTMETIGSECSIELLNDAKLEIKDADFDIPAGDLEIFGQGTVDIRDTWLTGQGMTLEITTGHIIIKDSHIDLEDTSTTAPQLGITVATGTIDLRENDFHVLETGGGNRDDMDIKATIGDIIVAENHFDVGDDLNIESMSGNVEVIENTGSVGDDLDIEGDDVTVNENDINVGSDVRFDADGDLEVKENNFGSSNTPVVAGSPTSCDIEDNMPAVDTSNCP